MEEAPCCGFHDDYLKKTAGSSSAHEDAMEF